MLQHCLCSLTRGPCWILCCRFTHFPQRFRSYWQLAPITCRLPERLKCLLESISRLAAAECGRATPQPYGCKWEHRCACACAGSVNLSTAAAACRAEATTLPREPTQPYVVANMLARKRHACPCIQPSPVLHPMQVVCPCSSCRQCTCLGKISSRRNVIELNDHSHELCRGNSHHLWSCAAQGQLSPVVGTLELVTVV